MNEGILHGTGVLVTRPAGQTGELTDAIEAAGGYVFQLPTLKIEPRSEEIIRGDLAAMSTPDIVIYVSRNAVLHGAKLLTGHSGGSTRIAAIGPATAAALTNAGLTPDIRPNAGFDSERLLQHAELRDVDSKKIIIVRGNRGRELLADTLLDRGASVDYIAVYERIRNSPDDQTLAKLQSVWHSGRIDVVIVMSIDSLNNLMIILPDDCRALFRQALLVTPSKRVIQTVLETIPGIRSMLAKGIQTEDLINAIVLGRHAHDVK